MDKEILKNVASTLKTLVKEQQAESYDIAQETEATKIALLLESNQTIVDAIQQNKMDVEQIAEVFKQAIKEIAIQVPKIDAPNVSVNVPEIKLPVFNVPESKIRVEIPEIKVPEPKVTVNIPKADAPVVNVAPTPVTFPEKIDVGLDQFTNKSPLPVISVDPAGNYVAPVNTGGGSARRVKIDNNASEPIPISGTISATFSADFGSGEIGSQTLRTVQATNAVSSVYVTGANGTIGVVTINPDGNPVYGGTSSGGGLTDTELRASHLDVQQVSGAIDSVNVVSTVGLTDTQLRAAHIDVQQVSGAIDSVNVLSMPNVVVTSITNSTAISILNGDGATLDPRNRNWTITETVPISSANTLDVKQVSGASDSVNVLTMPNVTVTSITNSTASALIDSSGVQYSGSNPVPTKEVRSATPSQSSPSVTVASTSILAANSARLGATIYNEGTATCYMKLGSTASLTSYTLQIASGGYYEVPFGYTGAIDGITSASTAQLRVTEIT